jgi:hypothetical protein
MKVPTSSKRIQILAAAALATFALAMAWSASAIARPIDDPALSAAVANPASSQSSSDRPVTSSAPQSVAASSNGFNWGDAGIGAGAALALTITGTGGLLVISSRRHRDGRPATTTTA